MRIGLFLRNLDEEFQITVFRGIRDRARELGVDFLCVQGATIRGRDHIKPRPFAMADSAGLDGLLVLSPVIMDKMEALPGSIIPKFLPSLPCVSVGLPIPGMASVTINNRRSLVRILEHLVLDHGYLRFLFLGGPSGHRDSIAREQTFLTAMGRFLPDHPGLEWIVDYGGFSERSAMETLRRHQDDRPYDAIVAANDNMAFGAQKFLCLHANPAWMGCAITGFDDIPQAALEVPPLTSVHQPLEELGALSLDRLIALIEGRRAPALSTIQSWPVIRESCGCPRSAASTVDEHAVLEERLEMVRSRALQLEQWLRQGGYLGRDLSSVTDLDSLLSFLDGFLAELGVSDFGLLAFDEHPEEGESAGPTKGSRLVYERRGGRRSAHLVGGSELDLEGFLSTRPGERWDFCLAQLNSGAEHLGLALYSVEDWAQFPLSSAMPHIANALKRLRVLASQEDRNRRLESMVEARTRDLILANERLAEEIEARKATEGEVLRVSEFERRRFGLDLHDDVCQRLAGISMYIKGFLRRAPEDPARLLAELAGLVDETLFLTRRYAHASFPIDLGRGGLDSALAALCETVAAQNGCACRYAGSLAGLDPPLTDDHALNVYRIAQEALHNAVKHGRAKSVEIRSELESGTFKLSVIDNGRGLGMVPESESQGLGLRSMAYRASQLGAGFSIERREGEGTSVRLEIPLTLNKTQK